VSQADWLRLQGTRYRCIPLYIPAEEFDPLSKLFLEVLRYEHNVSRLVRAFGLTERVIEDVLGDLIRRNRAVLVVQGDVKEIRLLDNAIPTVIHEPGETLDVWQDDATGLLLPAWIVDRHQQQPRRNKGAQDTDAMPLELNSGPLLVEPFLDGPDSQLIEMLLRSDDDLRQRDETFASLDRLTGRYRVRPQTLWLPVLHAEIQGQSIPLIVAENIPAWVARVWSVALRRESLRSTSEAVAFHVAATTGEEGLRVVHGWRALTRVESWRGSVDSFLNQMPPPISGYDLRAVREKQAALSGLLLSASRVEIIERVRSQGEIAWLAPVLDTSRSWILLVLPWAEQVRAALDFIRQRVETGGSVPNKVFLVLTPSVPDEQSAAAKAALQDLLGATRFGEVIRRGWPIDGPAVALGDWPEVRVQYAVRSSVLQFSGASLAADWLGVIQALPARNDERDRLSQEAPASDQLRLLRIRRDTTHMRQQEEARLGFGAEARSVGTVLDDLSGFGESLLTAIVDPYLLLRDLSESSEIDPRAPDLSFDRQRPLIQQVPVLTERRDLLCHHLSLSLAGPWAFWTRLSSHELIPIFAAVLTEPSRRSVEGEIHILASGLGNDACSASVLNLFEQAVIGHGWTIRVGLSRYRGREAGPAADRVLHELRSHIPSPRLRFWELQRPAPAHALVLDDLVFVAGGDWLQSVLCLTDRSDFGFALESRYLAESLRACFVGAKEITTT
jgi:hypothetical protein